MMKQLNWIRQMKATLLQLILITISLSILGCQESPPVVQVVETPRPVIVKPKFLQDYHLMLKKDNENFQLRLRDFLKRNPYVLIE